MYAACRGLVECPGASVLVHYSIFAFLLVLFLCSESADGDIYYFNFRTKESSWEHPCDSFYKEQLEREREKIRAYSGPSRTAEMGQKGLVRRGGFSATYMVLSAVLSCTHLCIHPSCSKMYCIPTA